MKRSGWVCLALLLPAAALSGTGGRRLDPFLDTLQARTLQYFLQTADSATGLVPDRWPTRAPASVAAVGFALTCYPIAAERGLVPRANAARRTLTTLRFLLHAPQNDARTGATGYRGLFYHFVTIPDATREWKCELSTVDTALLMAGVLTAQSYFSRGNGTELLIRRTADSLYQRVDWAWIAQGRKGIPLGWGPETGAEGTDWHGYNEAMILYILALGSPTHPVPPAAWDYWTSTYLWTEYYGREFVSFGPLFGHQFSHCWIDFRGIADGYMRGRGIDYAENTRRATYSQQAYAIANPRGFRGYSSELWGITACDGPRDTTFVVAGRTRKFSTYAGRGVSADWSFDDGTLAPAAAGGSLPFAPEICVPALKAMRRTSGGRLWSAYGFFDSFNPTYVTSSTGPDGWVDRDYIGIDQGPIAIMIENYRNGFVWNLMKKNPYVVRGLTRAGFTGGWLTTR
jgi:hypothetical protein